jgi:phosphoglycerate dehydrogenase-like enzyme
VSKVVLKDKKDMNDLFHYEPYFKEWDEIRDNGLTWEDYKIMGSQDEIERDIETEVLSVKFSKIGQKTFDAYPNLKWIQCRAHGSDNINLELAENRRVGIVCLDPDTLNVARWIDRWKKGPKVLLLGAGKIGRAISLAFDYDVTEVTSTTDYNTLYPYMDTFNTIIVASSPTDTPILDKALLKDFHGTIISISRPACIDNEALLEAANDGRITNAQMDMLDPKGRDELIATGKVTYHGHKAWEAYGITQYDERYFIMVFQEIQWLLRNDPKYEPPVRNSRIVLDRKSNALFGD